MNEPIDFSQWARQWESFLREGMARVPGAAAFGGGPAASDARSWNAAQGEAIERLLAAGQGYLGMLQSMACAASGNGSAGGVPPWFGAFASGNGFVPSATPWFANPVAQAMRGFGGNGAAGLELLMQRFTAAAGPMMAGAKGLLEQPAFGFLREHQEEAQASAKALIDYQEQMARYNRLMLKVGENAFATFQLKLSEHEEPGRQIDSAKGLYDLWIDSAEEAYAGIALSAEFRDIYGALVNAQMRVREHVQRHVERLSNEIGVPTRSEVDTIGERLQALRREFRAEREAAGDVAELSAEVAALRDEVAILRGARAPGPVSNVYAFERPRRATEDAGTPTPVAAAPAKTVRRARKAARKAKSVPQVARAASRSTTAEPKVAPKPVHAARKKTARAPSAGAQDAAAGASSFATRMARFARANADAGGAPVLNRKSKPAKR